MTNKYAVVLWIASLSPWAAASAQQTPNFTIDQAVTCSVHDAWVLGGKTEEGFFAIVKADAELAAQKRGLVLPDNETAGHQFGEYIKAQAKADHDQLLYVIVDRAVRKYGTQPPADAAK